MQQRRVGAREANQGFSALLAATERDGDVVIITRRGRAVARLIPEPTGDSEPADSAALAELIATYARPAGGQSYSRDELYDRGELGRLEQ